MIPVFRPTEIPVFSRLILSVYRTVVNRKERIRELCNQLLRAESPVVIQFVAGQLQKAAAELAIETALTVEVSAVLSDNPDLLNGPANANGDGGGHCFRRTGAEHKKPNEVEQVAA